MLWVVSGLLLLAVVFGPTLWVRWVMAKYADEIPGMPGTGGELARHLVDRHGLTGVEVELTDLGPHYDPIAKKVRLTRDVHDGKSLTAVSIAAHEVGHAIQDHQHDPRLVQRTRLVPVADRIARASVIALTAAPIIGLLTRHPVPISLMVLIGLSGLVARMLVHAVTLPVEWDASFGKALPIIEQGQYVAPNERGPVKRILRAAAYTYVAAALADLLNLARWAAILLRR